MTEKPVVQIRVCHFRTTPANRLSVSVVKGWPIIHYKIFAAYSASRAASCLVHPK